MKENKELERDDIRIDRDYKPTVNEAQLIKDMISEKIMQIYGQMPEEFWGVFYGDAPTIGGLT